jgi:hypothetical protein
MQALILKPTPILLLLFVTTLFTACSENEVSFNEAQPQNVKNRKTFKKSWYGIYHNPAESTLLKLEDRQIIMMYEITEHFSLAELDSLRQGMKDEPLFAIPQNYYAIDSLGDSASVFVHLEDTFFSISDSMALRFYKGKCYLNFMRDSASWNVTQLSLNDSGHLRLSVIHSTDSILNIIADITRHKEPRDEEGRVINAHIQPGKEEWRKMLNSGLFETETLFYRQ